MKTHSYKQQVGSDSSMGNSLENSIEQSIKQVMNQEFTTETKKTRSTVSILSALRYLKHHPSSQVRSQPMKYLGLLNKND